MARIKNENSLLFLYEGETEAEFYKKVFDKYIPPRIIRRNYGNLKGVYSLNDKVKSKISAYLQNDSFATCKKVHVIVAYDREGPRTSDTLLDIEGLIKFFNVGKSRISSINEIVATQDLESWFFHDLENIYKFLKVPKAQRNLKLYNNIEATNNRILSALFHKFNKHYQKGKRVQGFLNSLNIDKIYANVNELKVSVDMILKLCKTKSTY